MNNHFQNLRFRAAIRDFNNSVDVLAVIEDAAGHIYKFAKLAPLEMVENDDRHIKDPTFSFNREEAQSLLDALWKEGLRPTDHADPSGEIQRISDHLQDMRRLVFKEQST